MQDRLMKMFKMQRQFNCKIVNVKSIEEKQKWTKEFILAGMAEYVEALSEINWNTWKQKKPINSNNLVGELIDVQKFLINAAMFWTNDKEYFKEFERKTQVVEQKARQNAELEKIKKHDKKVCGIDLDGVIVEYPLCFINFINKRTHKKFEDLYQVKKAFSNSKYLYFKDEYRKSGAKQNASVYNDSKVLIDSIKKMGYSVIILTKRPYHKYFRIFADTKICLDRNKIKYDAIIFSEEKHKKIVKEFPKLKFMVEDNRNIANEVGNWGYKCFLIDNIYNQGEVGKNVIRVKNLREIIQYVK